MADARSPGGFGPACRRFNAGQFFEAHEGFEELLDGVEGEERWNPLVALIQVAVGYHKLPSVLPGAERMLRLGAEKLAAFPAVAWGVAVERLRARLAGDLAALETGDPGGPRLPAAPPRVEVVQGGPAGGVGRALARRRGVHPRARPP